MGGVWIVRDSVLRFQKILAGAVLAICQILPRTSAQSVDGTGTNFYQEMRWRCIGPFRAGRTVGVAGVASQPNLFYMGVNNGGVWKTTDAGRVWTPVFDDQATGSVGDVAVAASNPEIVYAGCGEGLQRPDLSVGDGVYKSDDGGKTWQNMGLRDAQQIARIIVAPDDPNRVFVAALGHPYGANAERGVFRSTDGGTTWSKVLYRDENTRARVKWNLIRPTRKLSTPVCGSRSRVHGKMPNGTVLAAACKNLWMAGTRGIR